MVSVFIPDRGSINLYHFLVYSLSNFRHVDFIPDTIYVNLHPAYFENRPNHIYDLLHILYPNAEIVHSVSCPEQCESLCQDNSEPVSRESGIDPAAYLYLRRVFLQILSQYTPLGTYSPFIYVSRLRDSTKRRVMNEHQFVNKLTSFQIIQMTGIPVLEQMYLFSQAKIVVSIHGAALTHILFCNPACKIIEIASNKMAKLMHFQHIAETLGLRYARYLDVYESTPDHYNFVHQILREKE
jgi:Glycosyltransferase 61